MTEKKTRVSLKGMSEEDKKERKKIQQREYMAKRRKEDLEFAQKQRELARKNMIEKRKNEEFNSKHREYCSTYNKKKKEHMQKINTLFDRFKRASEKYPECMISLKDNEIWIKTKEGMFISEYETTQQFVKRLNDIIEMFRTDDVEVEFDYTDNEIIVTKDGFPLFF